MMTPEQEVEAATNDAAAAAAAATAATAAAATAAAAAAASNAAAASRHHRHQLRHRHPHHHHHRHHAGAVAVAVATVTPAVGCRTVMASVSDVDNDVSMETNELTEAARESATDSANEATDSSTAQSDSARRRLWSRSISMELRERLVDGMLHELHRITGKNDIPHLRQCASRYEKLVLKRSSSETEYIQRIEQRISSLRRRPSQDGVLSPSTSADREPCEAVVPARSAPSPSPRSSRRSSSGRSSSSRRSPRSRRLHRSSSASSSSSSSSSSSLSVAERDDQYFTRLRGMKIQYRDEVALVYRELCRVNTVIQHSATLRRHESNNLGDFLTNLKKIIYLLEQQPDEMHGMIPQRKRTLEYLDVVESHIQRKVLPILYRLRHTYSTILRPLMLNYLRNCTRATRRL